MSQCQTVALPKRRFLQSLSLSTLLKGLWFLNLRVAWVGVAWGLMVPAAIASLTSGLSMEDARAKLSDLDAFPLFLPASVGQLVASSEQLSPTDMSEPSLSWIRDQVGHRYGSDRLVTQWQAYQLDAQSRDALFYVDVVVDEQFWGLLSYFERYAFMTQFGGVAQQYGYHLRVFHSGDVINHNDAQSSGSSRLVVLRGAHVCNFQQAPASAPLPLTPEAASAIPCAVVFDEANRGGRL